VVVVVLVVELVATGGAMVCVVRVLVESSATPFSFRYVVRRESVCVPLPSSVRWMRVVLSVPDCG
jgi:hypothetical protein